MSKFKRYIHLSICLLGLLLGNTFVHATEVIVNHSIARDVISRTELRAIYTMRQKYWRNGKRIRVFVLSDHNTTHRDFSKLFLGIFPHQLRRIWDKQVFSGTGQAPRQVETLLEMLESVENTPNAIGYIDTLPNNEKAHVIEIK